MFFVDSHCHLTYADYGDDLKLVIKDAEAVNIQRLLSVCTKMSDVPELLALAENYDHIFASVGIHPEYATEMTVSVDELCKAAAHPKVVAIGEAGLDYHYGSPETREAQKELFRIHLKAAKATGLPIIIHTREAEDDTIALLKEEADENLRGVLHCFSSEKRLADIGLEMGFYISASGIITFKSAEDIRQTFKSVPLNRLLLETDAPFLAPVPFRGRRNEPSFMLKTAEKLAEVQGVSLETLRDKTTENFFTLFSKAF